MGSLSPATRSVKQKARKTNRAPPRRSTPFRTLPPRHALQIFLGPCVRRVVVEPRFLAVLVASRGPGIVQDNWWERRGDARRYPETGPRQAHERGLNRQSALLRLAKRETNQLRASNSGGQRCASRARSCPGLRPLQLPSYAKGRSGFEISASFQVTASPCTSRT